jgi:hypothetical protein
MDMTNPFGEAINDERRRGGSSLVYGGWQRQDPLCRLERAVSSGKSRGKSSGESLCNSRQRESMSGRSELRLVNGERW